MQAMILAGGRGTRLRSVLADKPLAMAPLAGEPLLAHAIRRLVAQDVTDIIVATGYLAVPIRSHFGDGKAFGCRIRYSQEAAALGTAGALRNAEPLLDQRFLVMWGNVLLENLRVADLLAEHAKGGDAVLALTPPPGGTPPDVVLAADGLITDVGRNEPGVNTTWAGAALLEHRAVRLVPISPSDCERSLFPALVRRKALRGIQITGAAHRLQTPADHVRLLRAFAKAEHRPGAD